MRVLPADVYDTLEFASLAFGGIRGGVFCQPSAKADEYYDLNCPNCAHGLLMAAENVPMAYAGVLSRSLRDAGIAGGTSDEAVLRVNRRKGLFINALTHRVSFEEWCADLDVVRGE